MSAPQPSARGPARSTPPHHVIVISRRVVVREGLARVLQSNGYRIQAVPDHRRIAKRGQPSLFLVDVDEACTQTAEWSPPPVGDYQGVPVVGYCDRPDLTKTRLCLAAGYRGVLSAHSPRGAIHKAVNQVLAGNVFVEPALATFLLDELGSLPDIKLDVDTPTLTVREREIFQWLGAGKSNKAIANVMNVSVRTIESHKENMKQKLGLKSTTELHELAIQNVRSDYVI